MTPAHHHPLAPTRALGRSDLLVSPLCLGGNVFGWTADAEQSFAVLDAYVEQGGNFIDTADAYSQWVPGHSGGESERIIGDWMAARGNRADVVIATKVAKRAGARGLAPDTIRAAAEASLGNLRTDYIDLYYAHDDDATVPMADTLGAFDGLVRAGKVRHIAASNFTAVRLLEALALSAADGLASYVAIQNQYNLMERQPYEDDMAPMLLEHQVSSLPYYGLAGGFLTGKYRPGVTVDSPRASVEERYNGPRGDRVLEALGRVAAAHGATIAAVALAWLLTRPGIAAPLASARSTAQFADLVPMSRIELTADEAAALDDASS